MALFRLFFTNKILDKIAGWINTYIEANPVQEEEAPEGRVRPWFLIYRRELYTYFRVIIYIGIIIEPAIEDY